MNSFVLICSLLFLRLLGMIYLYFYPKEKDVVPPQRLHPDECVFILSKSRGSRFTRVPSTQNTRALVLLKHALCMMDGAYYLNANKYWATNWLHFSSFLCCLRSLNDTKSNIRHITILTSSNFFLWFFFSVGQYRCAWFGFVLQPHCLRSSDTANCVVWHKEWKGGIKLTWYRIL